MTWARTHKVELADLPAATVLSDIAIVLAAVVVLADVAIVFAAIDIVFAAVDVWLWLPLFG